MALIMCLESENVISHLYVLLTDSVWTCVMQKLTYFTRNMNNNVRFEVFTAVTMKNAVFWDVAPYSYCVNRRFGGTYRLHLQGRKIPERRTSVRRWLQPRRQGSSVWNGNWYFLCRSGSHHGHMEPETKMLMHVLTSLVRPRLKL
jgi:hypothetical protein